MIEDLALPTQWHQQNLIASDLNQHAQIPQHLMAIYNQLDWIGQSLDQLTIQLNIEIAMLTAYLTELELLGLSMQQSGLYLRCRSTQ